MHIRSSNKWHKEQCTASQWDWGFKGGTDAHKRPELQEYYWQDSRSLCRWHRCHLGGGLCLQSSWCIWSIQRWKGGYLGAQQFSAAFSPGPDPGDQGSSPTSGSVHGAYFSHCLCLCISVCVCLSWINKTLKKQRWNGLDLETEQKSCMHPTGSGGQI